MNITRIPSSPADQSRHPGVRNDSERWHERILCSREIIERRAAAPPPDYCDDEWATTRQDVSEYRRDFSLRVEHLVALLRRDVFHLFLRSRLFWSCRIMKVRHPTRWPKSGNRGHGNDTRSESAARSTSAAARSIQKSASG